MYEYQQHMIREAERLTRTVLDPRSKLFTVQEAGETAVYRLDVADERLMVYAVGIAFLQESLELVESQEREIYHLRHQLEIAQKSADEMAKIIAESAMYPQGDPEPPF